MATVFDIETNGPLETLDTVHSLVIKRDGQLYSYHGQEISKGLELLQTSQVLVGHNILCFDLPALKKVYGFNWDGQCFDTLNVSRLIYTNLLEIDKLEGKLRGSHSLEAWGQRLGITKGDFKYQTDWKEWSEEMQRYCEQDVEITDELYRTLQSKEYSKTAIELEHKFQKIIFQQERNGVLFDTKKAKELVLQIKDELQKREQQFVQKIPYVVAPGKEFTPKRNNKTVGYREGATFTKLSFKPFNPGSRAHVLEYLNKKYGYKSEHLTPKGNPKIDHEILSDLDYPEAQEFAEYFHLTKILGYLEKGKNAWLKLQNNGRIHGKMITNGAVTGRCTHSKPNLGQVPSARKLYGRECRALFNAGQGWMIGADASGLELRMLAHYLAAYDGGKYAREICTGDIHTANQRAANLETRDQAKTFIYAYCYGAGNAKLGSIVTGSKDAETNARVGKELRASFLSKVEGLQRLQEDVRGAANRGWLKGLDGRMLHIRSEHKSLNTLLQGGGAIVMKQANINFWESNPPRDCQQVLNVHDEAQLTTNLQENCQIIGEKFVDAIKKAGTDFNLRIPLDGEYKIGKNWSETH